MKQTLRCPRCDETRIFWVREVASEYGESGGSFHVQRLARVRGKAEGGVAESTHARGDVEAFVCRGCGYSELYTDPSTLTADGHSVVAIDIAHLPETYRGGTGARVELKSAGATPVDVMNVLMRTGHRDPARARAILHDLPYVFTDLSLVEAIALDQQLREAGAVSELV